MCAPFTPFDGIDQLADALADTVRPLLGDSALGRFWLICPRQRPIGDVVLGCGYTIEFGGRDAFIDELIPEQAQRHS